MNSFTHQNQHKMDTSIILCYFKGTPIQMPAPMEEIKHASESMVKLMTPEQSLKGMGEEMLEELTKMEQQLVGAIGLHTSFDMRTIGKIWGDDYKHKINMWCVYVYFLVKIKMLKDDDMNGFQTISMPNAPPSMFKKKWIDTCVVCAKEGIYKKCSVCRKDRYCGAECQKADWKRHKAVHH